ncbi:hypothetical protein BC830DRAFT_1165443 [Chytriomyces sp. MP71]|nr:hypothetical protein BC830DRAFT_1165443 [Chytriomyces sp. MP71]
MEEKGRLDNGRPNYSNFFKLLRLNLPLHAGGTGKPADLDSYFDTVKLGLAPGSNNVTGKAPSVNPYDPPEMWEPLSDWRLLGMTKFANMLPSLGHTIHWISSVTFFDKHYKLGDCLVAQESELAAAVRSLYSQAANAKSQRLYVYAYFTGYLHLIQACFATLLFLFVPTMYMLGWLSSKNIDVFRIYHDALLGGKQCIVSSTCAMVMIISTYLWSRKRLPEPGLLRYLRQLGAPAIEELMISYSWEEGITGEARGIARCLCNSGIGVWLDVLKLTSGDKTTKTTRTVAHHVRFVLIFLTEKYLSSHACFIEILEALSAPDATDRVILYVPSQAQSCERVMRLAQRLKDSGIRRVDAFKDLIETLNMDVLFSNDPAHLLWWQTYATVSSGIPDSVVAPSKGFAPKLSRFNVRALLPPCRGATSFPLFQESIRQGDVRISNLWLSGDCRQTGTKASSFPWIIAFDTAVVFLVAGDMITGPQNEENHSQTMVRLGSQAVIACVIFLTMVLNSPRLVDNRFKMHHSLRPLLATVNFHPDAKVSREFRSERGNSVGEIQSARLEGAVRRILTKSARESQVQRKVRNSQMPVVKVVVHDFGSGSQVALALSTFLQNLGFHYEPADGVPWIHRTVESLHEIYVPVFVFGASQDPTNMEDILIGAQVEEFQKILQLKGMEPDDCVLVAAVPHVKNGTVKGLFNYHSYSGFKIIDYLVLVGS